MDPDRRPEQSFAVITENDVSEWDDVTGVAYQFPKRYRRHLFKGTRVLYYKGRLQAQEHSEHRLSKAPHYFGVAEIGDVFPDEQSSKGDQIALIVNYTPFTSVVLAKQNGEPLEPIPENRRTNYWRDGVRPITADVFNRILSLAAIVEVGPDMERRSALVDWSQGTELALESRLEGSTSHRFTTTYERDRALRVLAIRFHGDRCTACGFSFSHFYGPHGEGFIHVHHTKPVSTFDGPTLVNPKTDLITLCPNCHAMIHRRKDRTLSIEELKQMIAEHGTRTC